jgi:FkbM family methyltransferase
VKHRLRSACLKLVQKTPFEHAIKDLVVRFSSSAGAADDRSTFQVIDRCVKEDSNCIDIGAYRGDILRRLVKRAGKGEIHAVEPILENCEYLRKKFPTVKVHNLALSDHVGKATFFHALGRPARSGLHKQNYPDPDEQVNEVAIGVATLDTLIPPGTRIDFVKIDVEGAELAVLRGGRELIRRWRPIIIFEHAEPAALKFGDSSESLRQFLTEECGMNISSMQRWLDGGRPYSPDEFHAARLQHHAMYFIAYQTIEKE